MQSKVYPPPFWCPLFRVLLHKVFPQRRCGYIIDVCVCSIVCIVEREPSWWSGKTRGNIIRRIQFQNEKARNLPNEVYSSRKTLLRSFRDPVECNDLSLNSLSSVHPIHPSSQKKIKTFFLETSLLSFQKLRHTESTWFQFFLRNLFVKQFIESTNTIMHDSIGIKRERERRL